MAFIIAAESTALETLEKVQPAGFVSVMALDPLVTPALEDRRLDGLAGEG